MNDIQNVYTNAETGGKSGKYRPLMKIRCFIYLYLLLSTMQVTSNPKNATGVH